MDMSPACTAPTQPEIPANHPRAAEYARYRSAMSRQMVTASTFSRWLSQTEEFENGRKLVFQVTSLTAPLAPGWYCNVFAPRRRMPRARSDRLQPAPKRNRFEP